MRYQPLPPSFHATNRQRLAEVIGPEAIAIIDTADVLVRSGDFTYPFRPDSNFYYLTGLDQPEAVLVLVPGSSVEAHRELLFVKETNEFMARWEGQRHTQTEAAELSGITQVLWLDEFDRILDRLLTKYDTIYLNTEESLESVLPAPAKRRAAVLREKFPLHQLRSALPILHRHRTIKADVEVAQIQRAVDVTQAGLLAAWTGAQPDMPEYAVEAELSAEFLRRGATGQAFMPIIAAGSSTTVLHYISNNATIQGGDPLLFDVGAEYGWYAADISRVIPVSGHFTPRQRAVYEAVWRTQQAGIALHKPGASIWEIDQAMRELLVEELVELGVMTRAQGKAKDRLRTLHPYFPHTSHHMGLEVHDHADAQVTFEPGMVVSCEPGIYLGEEGIGVRLEDDILITTEGHMVLSAGIPSQADEIEKLLAR